MLLALGRAVVNAKKPVHLNIILANTLLLPKGLEDMFGNEFRMQIDKTNYSLDTRIFDDMRLFDEALNLCEELAEQTQNQKDEKLSTFTNILKQQTRSVEVSDEVAKSFHQVYRGFKQVKEKGRDSIWKFIVQNLYKPYFLAEKFHYIVGNPPWFTFGSIRNEDYQDVLNKLDKEHDVKPARAKNFPNLEIAAIFLAYCSGYFLRGNGKIAFVLPRSFFSADHHDNTRSGRAKGFSLTSAWDLDGVSPLFRVPSCVLFAEKSATQNTFSSVGLEGKSFSGKIPAHNCNLAVAAPKLTEEDAKWFYVEQGNSSAFSKRRQTTKSKSNPYKKLFKKGADIIPRAFYFVDINQQTPPDFEDRIINVRTSAAIQPDAKKPWTNIDFRGRIESRFLFRTALSRSILPFTLFNPALIVLPITIEQNKASGKVVKLRSADELRQEGFLNASRWFANVEKTWEERRTDKNQIISAANYLNWHSKLVEQNLNALYLVLYNSSAQDANATVITRADINLDFVVDHVTYVFATSDVNEAHYLTAILNSSAPNTTMKDFQARGLFGARHVHKKILDIYFPRFNKGDKTHSLLARWSETAHRKASEFMRANPPEHELAAARLGRLRAQIKKHIEAEMSEIDNLVGNIIV